MYNPSNTVVSNESYAILNAIRNESDLFRTATPLVKDADTAKAFGEFVTGTGAYKELFWGILVNRIGMTLLSGREFKNKLAQFRRGKLGLGDIVQNIWVGLVKPEGWTSDVSNPGDVYRTNKPDAKVSMVAVNSKLSYEITTNDTELGYAFVQENGLYSLISKITERLLTSEQYDDYVMMKWIMAKNLLANTEAVIGMGDTLDDQASADALTAKMKEIVNDYPFMKTKYNEAHVPAPCPIDEIVFISTSHSRAQLDVYALSKAFNLTYEQFLGQEVQIDSFGFEDGDLERLYNIIDEAMDLNIMVRPASDDPHAYEKTASSGIYYFRFTEDELAYLEQITGAIIDKDWFMSFDKVYEMNAVYDAKHLNNNTFLTIHRIYSYNPFANVTYFTEAAKPTVDIVKTSTTIVAAANETLSTQNVTPVGATIEWSSSDTAVATVNSSGKVTGVAAGIAIITAKVSTLSGVATDKCTVTVTAS